MQRIQCNCSILFLACLIFCRNCIANETGSLFPDRQILITDFGRTGGDLDVRVPYYNKTEHAILLSKISVSCSCLRPNAESVFISAGEKGQLKFTVDRTRIVDGETFEVAATSSSGEVFGESITIRLESPVHIGRNFIQWDGLDDVASKRLIIERMPDVTIQSIDIVDSPVGFNCFLLPEGRKEWALIVSPKNKSQYNTTDKDVVIMCLYNQGFKSRMKIALLR